MTPPDEQVQVSARADLRLEQVIDELHRTTATLAISLKTLRRNPDNAVFRASAEQQFDTGKLQVQAVLSFPAVAFSEDAALQAAQAVSPFVELCRQLDGQRHEAEIRETCQVVADVLFDPKRLAADGRPCQAFEDLLSRHARLPAHVPADVPPPAAPEVLFERTFSHGAGTVTHEGFVGEMYIAYLQHVKGMTPDQVKTALSPAGLTGFAHSLEKALAGHAGLVTFRIVREAGHEPKVELHRAATG